MMIRQLAILFGCLALGEFIIYLTHIPLPSSILGMLLLTLLLKLKVIRLEWVRSISDFLVGNIGFFFLTSSSCHPKIFVKEFSYFLMSCH